MREVGMVVRRGGGGDGGVVRDPRPDSDRFGGTPVTAYPLRRPDDDDRFSIGLLIDVSRTLEAHGYPPVKSGADVLGLHRALFGFLYGCGRHDPAGG